jgi:hypothetical protein
VVTGSSERVEEVTAALQRGGVAASEIVALTDLSALATTCESVEPGSVRAYVQLPVIIASEAPTVTARFRDFLTRGIVARFDAAATVLPTLANDAVVVLVGGNTPAADTPADDQHARASLLRVLRWGLLADTPQRGTKVVLTTATAGPDEISGLALSGPPGQAQRLAALDLDNPDMGYDDWRLAVLSLASVDA